MKVHRRVELQAAAQELRTWFEGQRSRYRGMVADWRPHSEDTRSLNGRLELVELWKGWWSRSRALRRRACGVGDDDGNGGRDADAVHPGCGSVNMQKR